MNAGQILEELTRKRDRFLTLSRITLWKSSDTYFSNYFTDGDSLDIRYE